MDAKKRRKHRHVPFRFAVQCFTYPTPFRTPLGRFGILSFLLDNMLSACYNCVIILTDEYRLERRG